jgi:hypothetical protein
MLIFPCVKTHHNVTCELLNQEHHDCFMNFFADTPLSEGQRRAEAFARSSKEAKQQVVNKFFNRTR